MGRYLPEHVPDENEETNEIIFEEEIDEIKSDDGDQIQDFQDSKLQSMWIRAKQQGFAGLTHWDNHSLFDTMYVIKSI